MKITEVHITKDRAREAARLAQRCVSIVRRWLPIKGMPPVARDVGLVQRWYIKAMRAMVAFRQFAPTPGEPTAYSFSLPVPEDMTDYWSELVDSMVAIMDHYGWREVNVVPRGFFFGDEPFPNFGPHWFYTSEEIEPIDTVLLDRVEQVAQWFVELDPESDKERAERGIMLWNSGHSWREVTEQLYPDTDVDQALIDSTAKQIKRHADKTRVPLRRGEGGRKPKR